jgi:hypothetical protein
MQMETYMPAEEKEDPMPVSRMLSIRDQWN